MYLQQQKYIIESVRSGLPPEEKSDHVLMGKKSTQRVSPIKKLTKTKTDSGLSEKNKVNVVLVEEPLPSTSKGKTHYTKITQREEKTNSDSEYTSAFSRPHFDNPEDEKWAQMVSTQYSYLNQLLREREEKKRREGIESSESGTSDEEPVHSTSGGRTHSANMFLKPELRNEYEREHPPSEHPFAKMSNEEQWVHISAALYTTINKILNKDFDKEVKKMFENPESTICSNEVPIPDKPKVRTHLKRTAPERKKEKKYNGAHDSAPSDSGKPLVETDEESVDGQNESHCMPLKNLIKEDLKESLCNILGKYKYDTCMKKELPRIFEGRKQLRKISTEQKLKKKYDSKSLYSEQPATKTVKKVEHEHDALQYVHLMQVIKKDLKVGIREVLGKYKTNVCPKEEALLPVSKKKTRTKVEEKEELDYLYTTHFSSFEHRIAALKATAHVEPASAACAGYSGAAAVDQRYLEAIKLISMLKLK